MKYFKLALLALPVALFGLGAAGIALSDDDDHDDDHERHEHSSRWITPGKDVAPVDNALYTEECGACHMAYQPGLLPAAKWAQIMTPDALMSHYGDDASLPEQTRQALSDYLAGNSADDASRSRSRAFAVGDGPSDGLPRITETRYFRNEHDEIPTKLVAGNAEVGSFSKCNACHRDATEGVYNEHGILIPGVGRWDD